MAFMLGAFTGGLFGGAHSAMQLVNDWNILKNQRDMREAAGAVKGALDTAPQDNGVLPTVTDRAALPDAGTTDSGYNANGQPNIESMPLPNFMKPPLSAPPKAKLAGGG